MALSNTSVLPTFDLQSPIMATAKAHLLACMKSRTPSQMDSPAYEKLYAVPSQSFDYRAAREKWSDENSGIESAGCDSAFSGSTLSMQDKEKHVLRACNNNTAIDTDNTVIQEISVSSADGASGYLEPGFITPKAHLFRAMKYGSAAASSSMLSPSDHDRSSTNLQLHKHVYTGFAAFSSWPHTADNLPVHEDDVRCLTLDTDCTNKFPATSFAAGGTNALPASYESDSAVQSKNTENKLWADCVRRVSLSDVDVNVCNTPRRENPCDLTLHSKSFYRTIDVELDRWSLVLMNDGGVYLEGFYNGSRHRTKPVVRRLSNHVVRTETGKRYRLIGSPQTSSCRRQPLPDEVLLSFKKGFPWNWQELLQIAAEELMFLGSRKSVEMQSGSDVMPNTAHSLNVSLYKSKCKEAVAGDGHIARSRHSGRLLIPPLAFWANQRVIVPHKPGMNTQLIQGHDNLLHGNTNVCFTDPPQEQQNGRSTAVMESSKISKHKRKRSEQRTVSPVKAEYHSKLQRKKHCATEARKYDSVQCSKGVKEQEKGKSPAVTESSKMLKHKQKMSQPTAVTVVKAEYSKKLHRRCTVEPKQGCSMQCNKDAKEVCMNTSTLEIGFMSDLSDVEPDDHDHYYSDDY